MSVTKLEKQLVHLKNDDMTKDIKSFSFIPLAQTK